MAENLCPTCGEDFDSRRGLGVHHSRVHGERLPNRECNYCEDEFYCEYDRAYCSDTCHDSAVTYCGETNPNFSDAKETTVCNICGTEFEYYPSSKKGLYCTDCVKTADWRNPPEATGAAHPSWTGGKLALSCTVCESRVERYPSQIRGDVTLCSRECHSEWLSDAFTGDGHPNWRGGGIDDYGPGWREVRERALDRDGRACVLCGTDADELGRNPDVHHVVPVRLFAAMPVFTVRDAHTVDNVVSLCPGCHRRAEFGRVSRAELRWRAGIHTTLGLPA